MNRTESPAFFSDPDLQVELRAILERPLSPEVIDDYANTALNGLISVVGDATSNYALQPTIAFKSATETEAAAFRYYNLGDINGILDNVSAKAEELTGLDNLIAQAQNIATVITPPDGHPELNLGVGDGEVYKHRLLIPRLKTLLFILQNEFMVNVHDAAQLTILEGNVSENMMRREGYYLVDVPVLNRKVLICDEEGNASYVLDSNKLREASVDNETLINLSKDALRDYLNANPDSGKRIVYRAGFMTHVVSALYDLSAKPSRVPKGNPDYYLYPTMPEGARSLTAMRKLLGMSETRIRTSIEALGQALGPVGTYRVRGLLATAYMPEQQEMILAKLNAEGALVPRAPEGVFSISQLAERNGLSVETFQTAIHNLGDTLGPINTYKYGSKVTAGYDTEQQTELLKHLEENGKIAPKAPEGYANLSELTRRFGVNEKTIKSAVKAVKDSLGSIDTFRFTTHTVPGYSPDQQNIIQAHIEQFWPPASPAPEGILSMNGIAKALNLDGSTIVQAVKDLEEGTVFDTQDYRFKSKTARGFRVEQQAIIRNYLNEKGLLTQPAPDGVLSANALASLLGVGDNTMTETIKNLSDSLGETAIYKFAARVTTGYTPEQQTIITNNLHERGLLSPKAPDDVLSLRGITEKYGIDRGSIKKALKGIDLGDVKTYRFGPNVCLGYDSIQQSIILANVQTQRNN